MITDVVGQGNAPVDLTGSKEIQNGYVSHYVVVKKVSFYMNLQYK